MHEVKHEIEKSMKDELDKIKSIIVIFSVVMLCLSLVIFLYLFCYPLSQISEKLTYTKDLISLMPREG